MNYTCAIDTVYSLVESVMLLPEGRVWRDNEDLLLQAAEKIVDWRLDNDFAWTHDAREEFWERLCETFPAEMMPKGTVSAALDSAVDHLSRIVPVRVVVKGSCLNCQEDMGWYNHSFENALEVNTTNLKFVPSSLAELFVSMIQRQMKKLLGPGGKRVQCHACGSWGCEVSELSTDNIALPPHTSAEGRIR